MRVLAVSIARSIWPAAAYAAASVSSAVAFLPFGQADGALGEPHPFGRHTQLQIRRRRDNPRQIEQGAHAIGLDFERAAIPIDRFGELILQHERARQALMRIGIFGRSSIAFW